MATAKLSVFMMLSGVPLDKRNKNQILFKTVGEQTQYFFDKTLKSYTDFSYIREGNKVRVPESADLLKSCGYCMYQNFAYSNKWFYAFVDSVEYVNDGVCDVSFTEDIFQTWLFNFALSKCFVEREHVLYDTIGAHTVEENLPTGQPINYDFYSLSGQPAIAVYLASSTDSGSVVNNVYTGIRADGYGVEDYGALNDILSYYEDTPEQVALLTMIDSRMINNATQKLQEFENTIEVPFSKNDTFTFREEKYTPLNNKLYSFPYVYMTVDNGSGSTEVLRWENFKDNFARITISGTPTPKPCLQFVPENYSSSGNLSGYSFNMIFDNFPQCPWTCDTYRAWVAQTVPAAIANVGFSTAIGVAVGGAGGLATTLLGATGAITKLALENQYQQTHSKSVAATPAGSGVLCANNHLGFTLRMWSIKPEYARMVDDFFTRFGYRVDRYKIPELYSRTEFNYVKTLECNIIGDLPSYARSEIQEIFNSGVTLWHNTDVANYNVENKLTGEVTV